MSVVLDRIGERILPALLLRLARIFRARGHAALAATCLRQAARVDPQSPQPWYLLGRQHLLDGQYDRAEAALREALRAQPGHVEALNNLGVCLYETGRIEESAQCYQAAVAARPGEAAAWNNLGNARLAQHRHEEARTALGEALRLDAEFAEAHNNLGLLHRARALLPEAERAFRRALEIRPAFAGALSNLGGVLQAQGRTEDAVHAYEEALRLQPDLGEAHANLAILLGDNERLAHARSYYEQEVRRHPDSPRARVSLGAAIAAQGLPDEAAAHFEAALGLEPDFADAYANLAANHVLQGRVENALDGYRKALALGPNPGVQSSLAFHLNYSPEASPAQIATEYFRWGETYAPLVGSRAPRPRQPGAKLRVGYVSPDFRQHSVAYFIEPILRSHHRDRIEVFCYSNVTRPDALTGRIRALADGWRDIHRKSTAEVERAIVDDGIDVLLDLAGHTARNRLPVFARRPAPVQATYLGHPATTGMRGMDYRITDARADPPGMTESLHTEALVRLPRCFLAYAPPADAPPVAPPPFLRKGHVTFASFNNAAKINRPLVALWARILERVPGSRLFIKTFALSSAEAAAHLRGMFDACGVARDRVRLAAFVPGIANHLSLYAEADVALDTYPYHGTTTTCEALWMGVPVVSLTGGAHVSRVGASLLGALGLSEWAPADPDAYVERAVQLACDGAGLERWRRDLRPRMQASPLTDAADLARALEQAYADMFSAASQAAGAEQAP